MINVRTFTFRIFCLFALCTLVIGGLAVNSAHAASNIDVGAGGTNTTAGAAGTVSVTADTGTATVTGQTGATVTATTGTATIRSLAGAANVTGQTGMSVSSNTGTAQLIATTGAAVIAGQTQVLIQATTGTAVMQALAGNSNVTGTTGASLTVENAGGDDNGVDVGTASTIINGGTGAGTGTFLLLNDAGATFASGGGAVRVTGVADGVNPFDAVNYRQLQALDDKVDDVATTAYSGIASVAALAAIPEPGPGKKVAVGIGYGNYHGENAVAGGVKAHLGDYVNFTAGAGYSNSELTAQAGVGISLW